MDKKKNIEYIILKDKKTSNVEDICKIRHKDTETMSPSEFFLHRIGLFLNPFYNAEIDSMTTCNVSYDPRTLRKEYKVVKP